MPYGIWQCRASNTCREPALFRWTPAWKIAVPYGGARQEPNKSKVQPCCTQFENVEKTPQGAASESLSIDVLSVPCSIAAMTSQLWHGAMTQHRSYDTQLSKCKKTWHQVHTYESFCFVWLPKPWYNRHTTDRFCTNTNTNTSIIPIIAGTSWKIKSGAAVKKIVVQNSITTVLKLC